MKLAPIQLLEYVLEEVLFQTRTDALQEAAEGDEPEAERRDQGGEDTLAVAPQVLSYPNHSDRLGSLRLIVSVNEKEEGWGYYRIRMSVVGRFMLIDEEPSVDEEQLRRYYLSSGLSILYGILRALIVQLCSTSPHPRLILPSTSFAEMVEELLKQSATSDDVEK